MSTPVKVFAVDASTGQVYIRGNVFVQSAEQMGDSWISGEMFNASTAIQLADGAIVLDGTVGRVTIFDPANKSNGNFLQIENGFVRQYEKFHLVRKLVNIETGSAPTDTWVALSGFYKSQPEILVSPKLINTFDSAHAAQDQSLSCAVTAVEKTAAGQYRFKANARLLLASGDFYVTPPTRLKVISAGDWQNNPSVSTKTTTTAAVTCQNCNRIRVAVEFMPVFTALYNRLSYWYGGFVRWRIKYRQSGTSAWSYSAWSATYTPSAWNDWAPAAQILEQSVGQGTYEVCCEVYTELTVPLKRFDGHTEMPPSAENDYFKVTSITLNSSASSVLASGLLSYTAVGE